ncbi:PilW family protein [Ramlibacter sp. WS9]|uniref:PilW family protein n=1 Tax=Ramlibacter sp. WS9 TaxID=1882741 RepID=UPI0011411850|nr:prepilin-type N-terminal cleavage/methylation domain-containing protein [Ramlibacter sp. WS9]ROZ68595.1 prepilin-type N-terminal cleavage/methylation domain-containing protein [Ramlibacter sp. WS9]
MIRTTRSPFLQRGFTLMELVIVVVVLGFLSAVGSTMIVDTFKTTKMVYASQSAATQARYAVERLAREIRQVKYTGSNYVIGSITSPASSASFTNVINGVEQAVSVDVNGTDLRLSYGAPLVLCGNVSGFTVNYLQLDNSAATSTANVRFVVISLTVTDGTSGQSITERLRVALRSS